MTDLQKRTIHFILCIKISAYYIRTKIINVLNYSNLKYLKVYMFITCKECNFQRFIKRYKQRGSQILECGNYGI